MAGMVKTTPAATESLAEPVVCTMLFSRIEVRPSARKIVIDSTAIGMEELDRKSTRLNSSHLVISYAVFCLKKKNQVLHRRCPCHLHSPATSIRPCIALGPR